MTLSPNTQITQENVGLLSKGAWLLLDGQPVQFINTFMGGIRAKYDAEKRTSALPFSRFTYIGPDLGDGWIGWSGGENPVPGMRVDYRLCEDSLFREELSDDLDWSEAIDIHGEAIIAFRPALSPPAEGEAAGMSEDERRRWLAGRDDWQEDQWQDHCGKAGCEECSGEIPMTRRRTPTPAPVDWNVVGPKLVEALERIAADGAPYRNGYCQTDIAVDPALTAEEAQKLARQTLEDVRQ